MHDEDFANVVGNEFWFKTRFKRMTYGSIDCCPVALVKSFYREGRQARLANVGLGPAHF